MLTSVILVHYFSYNHILVYVFYLVTLVQLFYYLYYFSKLAFYRDKQNSNLRASPVSVIIAAKDEEVSLRENLPLILGQTYSHFEVIVVNNQSKDGTLAYLNSIEDKRLVILTCQEKGKKAAIEMGIKSAKYEQLAFIDADCQPSSSLWLSLLSGSFTNRKKIVLGFGAFKDEPTLINKLIQFEGILNAMQYLSFALRGRAYMGVGRNLAYSKSIYDGSSSFKRYGKLMSGDDDLIVNEMATKTNTAICIDKNAHTLSKAKDKWVALFYQKRRQLVAGNHYKLRDRFSLGLFGVTNFLHYFLFIIILIQNPSANYILEIFVFKQILVFVIFSNICAKLAKKGLPKWIPIIEPLYLFFITLVGISTWIWKVDRWE